MANNTSLPGFVLAQLYGKSLVFIKDNEDIVAEKQPVKAPQKKFLGDYKKKVIVLINDAENLFLSDAGTAFLSGVLNACKLSVTDVALLNFNTEPVNFLQLKKEWKPEFLLLFGLDALQIELPFTMPQYQVQQYDKCAIVTAPSLSELNQTTPAAKTEKAKLWKSLQKMFSLEK